MPELIAQRPRDTRTAGRQPRQLYAVAAVSALGGLLFGYDTGIISGALLHLREDLHLSSRTQEVVVSVILVGAMVGALWSGRLAVRHGRRRVVQRVAVVFAAGALASAVAPDTGALVAARFVLGLAVGGASNMVPVYIAEAAPAAIRIRSSPRPVAAPPARVHPPRLLPVCRCTCLSPRSAAGRDTATARRTRRPHLAAALSGPLPRATRGATHVRRRRDATCGVRCAVRARCGGGWMGWSGRGSARSVRASAASARSVARRRSPRSGAAPPPQARPFAARRRPSLRSGVSSARERRS
jgi:Sugar (and other) transporter